MKQAVLSVFLTLVCGLVAAQEATAVVVLDRWGDPHLKTLSIHRRNGVSQPLNAVRLKFDQHRSDVKATQPAEMAFKPVAASRQNRSREGLSEPRPVAADRT